MRDRATSTVTVYRHAWPVGGDYKCICKTKTDDITSESDIVKSRQLTCGQVDFASSGFIQDLVKQRKYVPQRMVDENVSQKLIGKMNSMQLTGILRCCAANEVN